jgi:hypothetical protein
MRRRDVPKVLVASIAGGSVPAAPAQSGATAQSELQRALAAHGAIRIAAGSYRLAGKLQTLLPNNIAGDSRNETILVPGSFPDYVLEVGNGSPGPNAGKIERLRFYGSHGNLGCLHMNNSSHMWRLEDLIFSGGPCPALVVDGCWDSNYTDIDILAHVAAGSEPAKTAAVIFRNGCNNIYCRGLRIEGAHSGGIYTDSGPIYVVTGKIDDGFGGPQTAAAITVAAGGQLVLEDFYIGGVRDHYQIDVAGTLKLGRVFLDGGTNRAAIYDHRAWTHQDPVTRPTFSGPSAGPEIPLLDLGGAEFRRSHPSVDTETPAAVYSKIHPIRQVKNLRTVANGAVGDNQITVGTDLPVTRNSVYRHSFLVHNSSGTRRKIVQSFAGGNLVLERTQPVVIDGDWSIEYCETHHTPIQHEGVWLAPGLTLFAVVSRDIAIESLPMYVATPSDAAYGTTKLKIGANAPPPGHDVAGLFLVDNATGQPYYIEYGIDAKGFIGVIYDRRGTLTASNKFSIVAGYSAREALRHKLVQMTVDGGSIAPDLSLGKDFEIVATGTGAISISDPLSGAALAGLRITLTLVNATRSALADVTWGAAYKLAPWINPAPAHSRSIDFRYNGRHWIEVARTPVDVPG